MKIRLDKLLPEQGYAENLQKSQALIIAGKVEVNGRKAEKAGMMFPPDCLIMVKQSNCPYVSRGGLKLAKGLDFFHLDPRGLTCADIGASTGGFTDCLLQHGASLVYAVDVGYGQLDWSLRQDPRVVVMERTNARNLLPADIPRKLHLAVIDAAFISLKVLLPPLLPLFAGDIAILALIKPQFEVSKDKVGEGGVVRDPDLHQEVLEELRTFSTRLGLQWQGVTTSPILGPKGNKEFLTYLRSPQL
jgi:23S rRNA (cytidine1920-2'-O)/16S rRNA (cytidine1409-2'-O)-methyltransferase